jgi:hypothetical protein
MEPAQMGEQAGARQFTLRLSISSVEYERLYRGEARTVVARDTEGRTLQFPAASLQPFLTHSGIQGTFVISIDADNRLLEIRRASG